jgi:carboxypeptidase Q
MHRRLIVTLVCVLLAAALTSGQQRDAGDMVARIKAEGQQRSSALVLYRTLTDDIGARLTGSPAHMHAARWALDRFKEWGLANPRLEPYEFGRGWQLERVSVELTEPRYVPLNAYAEAWSPSTAGVVNGRVVYVGDKTGAQIQAMATQLRGAIVLTHLPVTDFVSRDRPQPGLDERPVATGNPPSRSRGVRRPSTS